VVIYIEVKNENEIMRVEVKTIISKRSQIHLTANQVLKALEYKKEYYIYIVFLNKLEEDLKAVIYKINDPINFFKIDKSIIKDSV
jgi:prophage antirepressor-like protein